MKRRILSLLLALCMVLSLLPATAFAAETEETTEPLFKLAWGTVAWDVYPDSVYYATTTSLTSAVDNGTTNPGDNVWTVKLDTTGDVPTLTLRGAKYGSIVSGDNYSLIIGEKTKPVDGDFNIVIEGDCQIPGGSRNAVALYIDGTTTISSTTGGKLTVSSNSTSQYSGLCGLGKGDLYFKDVNVIASIKANRTNDGAAYGIKNVGNIVIDGGSVTFTAYGNIDTGVYSSAGNITVKNFAKVSAVTGADKAVPGYEATKRYVLRAAGNISIESAFVEMNDTGTYSNDYHIGSYDAAFNKIPAISNAKVYYKESIDGELREFNIENGESITSEVMAMPYFLIEGFCPAHDYDGEEDLSCNICGEKRDCPGHKYDDKYTDTTCNICGEIREVPKELTATFTVNFDKDETTLKTVTWTAAPGETYYATTTADGNIESLGALTEEPEAWNIKLDNTKPVAELTLRKAYLKKTYEVESSAIRVSGDGALKIIVDGATTVHSEYVNVISTEMDGGTTITSLNNSLLTLKQQG
ncbi:MAG: hypothetical protein IJN31_02685, partial [Peptococcaceae bacterium]|nr:hypothetical protein [Peptococcaceae bacterium]